MKKAIPAGLLVISIAAMILLQRYWPVAVFLHEPLNLLGIVVIIGGASLIAAGAYQIRKGRTPIKPFCEPVCLVTGGVYRYTRNPMYLGVTIVLLGAWIITGAVAAFLPIPFFIVAIDRACIKWEEKVLERKFPQEFSAYKSRVRRWI